MMSKKCRAYSESKIGLAPADNRKAFYAGWEAALRAAIEQEPVAWRYRGNLHEFDPSDWAEGPVTPLYTAPPRREWQGLTEAEKVNVALECGCADVAWMDFADAIETKLREKNT